MKRKNQAGITLVALVVTIVVLLILAGISISLVLGENGLISNAKEAREQTKSAEVNEKAQMDNASDWIIETVANLPKTEKTKPYMPSSEFVKVEGTNLENGLTIQDASGNQYVWVEVPMTTEVYPTAGLNITEFNDDVYTKIENDLHSYTSTYRNETNCKDEYCDDDTDGWFENEEEYNNQKYKMLKSVYQNGGFWVARYEAGRTTYTGSTKNPKSQKNLYPYNYITRTQAEVLAKTVQYKTEQNEYTGSLMFGVQWDLMLKFIENKKIESDNEIVTKLNDDSTSIGNYYNATYTINRGKYAKYNEILTWYDYTTDLGKIVNNSIKSTQNSYKNGVILTTGAVDQHSIMNICDIAGNVCEWTLESVSPENDESCVLRGGKCYSNGYEDATSSRFCKTNSYNHDSAGFRICLY